jgi:hypothetical protein
MCCPEGLVQKKVWWTVSHTLQATKLVGCVTVLLHGLACGATSAVEVLIPNNLPHTTVSHTNTMCVEQPNLQPVFQKVMSLMSSHHGNTNMRNGCLNAAHTWLAAHHRLRIYRL